MVSLSSALYSHYTLSALAIALLVVLPFPLQAGGASARRKLTKKATQEPIPTPDPTPAPGPKTLKLAFDALRLVSEDVASIGFESSSLSTGNPQPTFVGATTVSFLNLFPFDTVTAENVESLHADPSSGGAIGTIEFPCIITNNGFSKGLCQGVVDFLLDGEPAGAMVSYGGHLINQEHYQGMIIGGTGALGNAIGGTYQSVKTNIPTADGTSVYVIENFVATFVLA
ncbi:unnamed protein product [Pseudo-nitzschia multistriata]|uniref:Dirigent protein n=1 Tax=Pseudo-nitzschia multistriata TaxID=183589 RepID=A0A448Z6I9_9STRA|nr:unnamed protein product [Pseudo-nitzschia multistriata]